MHIYVYIYVAFDSALIKHVLGRVAFIWVTYFSVVQNVTDVSWGKSYKVIYFCCCECVLPGYCLCAGCPRKPEFTGCSPPVETPVTECSYGLHHQHIHKLAELRIPRAWKSCASCGLECFHIISTLFQPDTNFCKNKVFTLKVADQVRTRTNHIDTYGYCYGYLYCISPICCFLTGKANS